MSKKMPNNWHRKPAYENTTNLVDGEVKNAATPLQEDSESSDGSNPDDDKSLQSFDNIHDLGEFFGNNIRNEVLEEVSTDNIHQISSRKFPSNMRINYLLIVCKL